MLLIKTCDGKNLFEFISILNLKLGVFMSYRLPVPMKTSARSLIVLKPLFSVSSTIFLVTVHQRFTATNNSAHSFIIITKVNCRVECGELVGVALLARHLFTHCRCECGCDFYYASTTSTITTNCFENMWLECNANVLFFASHWFYTFLNPAIELVRIQWSRREQLIADCNRVLFVTATCWCDAAWCGAVTTWCEVVV